MPTAHLFFSLRPWALPPSRLSTRFLGFRLTRGCTSSRGSLHFPGPLLRGRLGTNVRGATSLYPTRDEQCVLRTEYFGMTWNMYRFCGLPWRSTTSFLAPGPGKLFWVKLGKRDHPCQGVCYVLCMAGKNGALFFSFQVRYF